MGWAPHCLGQILAVPERGSGIYGPATLQLAHKRITGEMPKFWRCTEEHSALGKANKCFGPALERFAVFLP